MVVYLAVDSQSLLLVWRVEWLSAALWVYDGQTLVGEDGCLAHVYAAPVWSAMSYLL